MKVCYLVLASSSISSEEDDEDDDVVDLDWGGLPVLNSMCPHFF